MFSLSSNSGCHSHCADVRFFLNSLWRLTRVHTDSNKQSFIKKVMTESMAKRFAVYVHEYIYIYIYTPHSLCSLCSLYSYALCSLRVIPLLAFSFVGFQLRWRLALLSLSSYFCWHAWCSGGCLSGIWFDLESNVDWRRLWRALFFFFLHFHIYTYIYRVESGAGSFAGGSAAGDPANAKVTLVVNFDIAEDLFGRNVAGFQTFIQRTGEWGE